MPKLEHLNVVIFIIECIQITSLRELNLSAALDVVVAKLRRSHIVRVDCVDFDSVQMGNHCIKATWMKSNGLNQIWQLLHNLKIESSRVGRVLPDHDVLV